MSAVHHCGRGSTHRPHHWGAAERCDGSIVTLAQQARPDPLEGPARPDEIAAAAEQRRIQEACEALGLPFESPDGHGTRRYTWPEVLDNIRGRSEMWRTLMARAEEVDAE